MGTIYTNPAKGRWGWMSQIYDETRHLDGIMRSRAIVERCADCGIKAPAKHITAVNLNPLPRPRLPTTPPIPTTTGNPWIAIGCGVAALFGLAFLAAAHKKQARRQGLSFLGR